MAPLTKFSGGGGWGAVGNKIAAHDRKVGCNTVEYATAFLYSD